MGSQKKCVNHAYFPVIFFRDDLHFVLPQGNKNSTYKSHIDECSVDPPPLLHISI